MLMKIKLMVVQLHIIMRNIQIILFIEVYSWQKIMNTHNIIWLILIIILNIPMVNLISKTKRNVMHLYYSIYYLKLK